MEMTEKEQAELTAKAVGEITDRTDGPVTEFTAITRAMQLAASGWNTFICACALNEVLENIRTYGTIPSDEY